MAKNKKKYYVVWEGVNPGIYESWTDCQLQIKGYQGAKYKSFKTLAEAKEAFEGSSWEESITRKGESPVINLDEFKDEIEQNSICVDAACSGNPGKMEYRGVDTWTGEELFRQGPYFGGTNNVGEFLALIHALATLKKTGRGDIIIYTDSRTGMAWLRNKKVKTTLKKTKENVLVHAMLDRATKWMLENTYENKILKWDTDRWGEIPADFGRK